MKLFKNLYTALTSCNRVLLEKLVEVLKLTRSSIPLIGTCVDYSALLDSNPNDVYPTHIVKPYFLKF